jgi:RHS repeat-associated protein
VARDDTSKSPLNDAQYTSSDTGLIYMRARTYDPSTAQFLTRDPWVAITGEPYSYVAGNPLTFADPTGRCSAWCVVGVVAGGPRPVSARSSLVAPFSVRVPWALSRQGRV